LFQSYRSFLVTGMLGLLSFAPMGMFGQGAAPADQTPKKNWKDRAEYDLYDGITKDTNAKTRLDKIEQWQKQYPTTDYKLERETLLVTTHAALNQPKETTEAAKRLLADDPKNFTALYYTAYVMQSLYGQTQSVDLLGEGEKASTTILGSIDTPPAGVTADQWAKLRPDVEVLAHVNLGFAGMVKKNWDAAETEFGKSLQFNPNNGQVDYWMAFVIYSQKKPERYPTAIFYFERAGTYEGQGAAAPDLRKQGLDFAKRLYKNYHGSEDGFNDVVALAKSSPTAPADMDSKIESIVAITKKQFANEEDWRKAHPQEALWKDLKTALTAADGSSYFDTKMKDAELPTLKAKVVSLEPANKPKSILVAVEDGSNNTETADATLKFEAPLPGKVDAGTELTFEGVPLSYTSSPLMVVFNVDKDKLHGWTGKNPAPVHHKPRAKTSASK